MSRTAFIYEKVADEMVKAMQSTDTVPWRQPWSGSWLPRNGYNGRLYKGVNVWLLQAVAWNRGFKTNDWFTFKNAFRAKGVIKEGVKSPCFVVYWKQMKKATEPEDAPKERGTKSGTYLFIRYYPVWNKDQIVFSEDSVLAPEVEELTGGDKLEGINSTIAHMQKDGLEYAQGEPCYIPHYDRVEMPPKDAFINNDSYASVLFHELSHATMHPTRLHRDIPKRGDSSYAREELIAELASSYICQYYQITSNMQEKHAKYLKHWCDQIKEEPKYIFTIARAAQEAARYVLNYPTDTVWKDENGREGDVGAKS